MSVLLEPQKAVYSNRRLRFLPLVDTVFCPNYWDRFRNYPDFDQVEGDSLIDSDLYNRLQIPSIDGISYLFCIDRSNIDPIIPEFQNIQRNIPVLYFLSNLDLVSLLSLPECIRIV